jgi:UDP-glucose 4-epimerase
LSIRESGVSSRQFPRDLQDSLGGLKEEGFIVAQYLVTGGAGFIGSHLVAWLVEDGHSVRVLDNLCAGNLENLAHLKDGVEFLQGDVADPDACANAVKGTEVVFHQAALASVPLSVDRPLDTHKACVTGTVTVLDACVKAGVRRVVYAASSSAYGNDPEMPKREAQRPEVLSPYAAAKLAGELYCESFASSYDLETVRLRYFNIFGPRQDPDSPYSAVIPLFVSALVNGRRPKIFGDGTQSRDFTYVQNVVEANMRASVAEGVSGNVYNVACGESLSVLDLLKEICNRLGVSCDPEFLPARAGDVKHSWADISATKRDLGYEVKVPWVEGLGPTIDFYAQQASLDKLKCGT